MLPIRLRTCLPRRASPLPPRSQSAFATSAIPAVLLAVQLLIAVTALAQMPKEKPAGYVSDFAGVLSGNVRQRIESLATELDQKAHAQIAVVTVASLEDRPIEDFSIDLATKW